MSNPSGKRLSRRLHLSAVSNPRSPEQDSFGGHFFRGSFMKNFVLITLTLMLAACTQTKSSGSDCGFAQEFFLDRDCLGEEIQKSMNECKTRETWIEKMECRRSVGTTYHRDPLDDEISAYIGVLIENVKTHKMTQAQADYAFQQKVAGVNREIGQANENSRRLNLIERQQDALAHQQRMEGMYGAGSTFKPVLLPPPVVAPAPIKNPTRTDCQDNGSFGISCTTY